jgi:hypothetical protein
MSIATLKRKTAAKYNNSSVNSKNGFSLNGGYRNQGYVGQTSLSRSLPRTPMKGNTIRGHGGCCGIYRISPIVQSGVTSTEDNSVIKKSVINTKGMLSVLLCDDPCNVVKPDSSLNANTQGEFISRIQKNVLSCEPEVETGTGARTKCITGFGAYKQKTCLCTKPVSEYMPLSGSDYTENLRTKCTNNDIVFVPVAYRREPIR